MKKLEVFMAVLAIMLLFCTIGMFGHSIWSDVQEESRNISEISEQGIAKVISIDYDREVVVAQAPDGKKRVVHARFADKRPAVGETWRVIADSKFLKFLSRQ